MRAPLLGLSIALLLAAAAGAQWQLEQSSVTSGAHAAASASFQLEGCLAHDPAGLADSASYTVYAGCAAQAVVLPGDGGGPEPPVGPPPVVEIPTLSGLGAAALVALLAAGGLLWLRRAT